MNLVDRINRLVLKRVARGRPLIGIVGDEIRIGREGYPLADLAGAVAHEVDVYAGTTVALTLSFGGRTVTVTAEEPCWTDLLAALDRLALTTVPSRDWTVAVSAGVADARPIVLRRNGRPSPGEPA